MTLNGLIDWSSGVSNALIYILESNPLHDSLHTYIGMWKEAVPRDSYNRHDLG